MAASIKFVFGNARDVFCVRIFLLLLFSSLNELKLWNRPLKLNFWWFYIENRSVLGTNLSDKSWNSLHHVNQWSDWLLARTPQIYIECQLMCYEPPSWSNDKLSYLEKLNLLTKIILILSFLAGFTYSNLYDFSYDKKNHNLIIFNVVFFLINFFVVSL